MTAFYNEIDPYCCAWLSNLMDAGLITPGKIDDRSIEDIKPEDLTGYERVHMFAGIGVWDYALNQAGWEGEVWTGSCPCQPFSVTGKKGGFDDERHLWPAFHWLIQQRQPSVVFGEQVASKDGLAWLDLVQTDLENTGYTSGAIDLCAAGVGAPHIRQRLWFVAERLANPDSPGPQPGRETAAATGHGNPTNPDGSNSSPGPTNGFWRDVDWLGCRDGKWRPVKSGTSPLAHGITNRVGKLRAYGNAINAEAATEFIKAYINA